MVSFFIRRKHNGRFPDTWSITDASGSRTACGLSAVAATRPRQVGHCTLPPQGASTLWARAVGPSERRIEEIALWPRKIDQMSSLYDALNRGSVPGRA